MINESFVMIVAYIYVIMNFADYDGKWMTGFGYALNCSICLLSLINFVIILMSLVLSIKDLIKRFIKGRKRNKITPLIVEAKI